MQVVGTSGPESGRGSEVEKVAGKVVEEEVDGKITGKANGEVIRKDIG